MRTSDKEIQKRLDTAIEYLSENGETHIEDLANYLSVSPLTVRRNIRELQEQHIIELKNSNLSLTQSAQKRWMRLKNKDARAKIQQSAAALIKPGDVCYINTSYTALGILQYIKDVPCTVITNNVNVINIDRPPQVRVVLTGGDLHSTRSSVVGEAALRMLNYNRANKAFIGIDAISLESGLNSNDFSEAALTQQMIEGCTGEVVLVATSNKLNQSAPFFVASLNKISVFVTDNQINMLTLYEMRDNRNIDVIVTSV